jgi:hypothetical protein
MGVFIEGALCPFFLVGNLIVEVFYVKTNTYGCYWWTSNVGSVVLTEYSIAYVCKVV